MIDSGGGMVGESITENVWEKAVRFDGGDTRIRNFLEAL